MMQKCDSYVPAAVAQKARKRLIFFTKAHLNGAPLFIYENFVQ
jgi:hypothetical protein